MHDYDMSQPSTARVYCYLLGGKDFYPADARAAEALIATVPSVRDLAFANYRWAARVAEYCAAELGIDQFIDIGTGIPLLRADMPSTFEAVHAVNPAARVIGIDNDPVVLVHGRALRDDHSGRVTIREGDVRKPEQVIDGLRDDLDFDRPVCVLMAALLHFVTAKEDPYRIVRTLAGALVPGSRIAISHVTRDGITTETARTAEQIYDNATSRAVTRTEPEIARLFDGMELDEPGLVDVQQWRPRMRERETAFRALCGVGRVLA